MDGIGSLASAKAKLIKSGKGQHFPRLRPRSAARREQRSRALEGRPATARQRPLLDSFSDGVTDNLEPGSDVSYINTYGTAICRE
jgi:hypothetical protein